MRQLTGERTMVRIFFGDSDRWHHQSLEAALLERLRREGFAGATVFRGVAGFGANSVIHRANLLELSGDLPVVVEIVESEEQVQRLLPILDEMLDDGLVTMEKVNVVRYAAMSSPAKS